MVLSPMWPLWCWYVSFGASKSPVILSFWISGCDRLSQRTANWHVAITNSCGAADVVAALTLLTFKLRFWTYWTVFLLMVSIYSVIFTSLCLAVTSCSVETNTFSNTVSGSEPVSPKCSSAASCFVKTDLSKKSRCASPKRRGLVSHVKAWNN